ncbi:hypothetical protein FAZ95_25530 [Trinickia violacea]|uniref:Fis family transcriptional regulator n=1 Tax=Trinickia violacea TaxID=2571746 RepID=A0A4P8J2B5_9BURK|nr:hypothetical protein [Trinickia violacea]QCP52529.1 hypothetical protein FAZ95_25530 [Trinickia violacea]
MALRARDIAQPVKSRLSDAVIIDLSLRNHLSLSALRSEHGCAFHLGIIVRTMFASFYLFDAGFGDGNLSIYIDTDRSLGELAMSRSLASSYSLGPHAFETTARLLELYDSQLRTAPFDELIAAHQRAERNFHASAERRLSIPALVQRSRRR